MKPQIIDREQQYINSMKSIITNALINEDTTFELGTSKKDKSEIEALLSDILSKSLPNLFIIDTFIIKCENNSITSWFAILEDEKYQYQASKMVDSNQIIANTTYSRKEYLNSNLKLH